MPLSRPRLGASLAGSLLAICGGEAIAHNEDSLPDGLSGALSIVSDYVDRGISQSDGHGAVQGGLKWRHSTGAYVALRGSTVDFDDGEQTSAEANYVFGLESEYGATQFDVSVAYIDYPGAPAALEYDLVELGARLTREVGTMDVRGQAIFSPAAAGASGRALYVAFEAATELTETVNTAIHVGRQWHQHTAIAGPDYYDWGLAFEWRSGRLGAALSLSGTDHASTCMDTCGTRLAVSVEIAL